jgi:hypothetical protein
MAPNLPGEDMIVLADSAGTELPLKNCYEAKNQHPGETPMIRTWKLLGLKAALAAAVTLTPALARADETAQKTDKADPAIKQQLTELKQTLDDIKLSVARLVRIEQDVKDLRSETTLSAQSAQNRITAIRADLSRLQQDFLALRDTLAAVPVPQRTSAYPPAAGDSAQPQAPIPNTGRIELSNTYPQEMTIAVNLRTYRVPPGHTILTDPMPAGNFTYQVIGVQLPLTRTLHPGEIFQIYVHPQL